MDTILLWCLAIFLAYVWVAPDYIDGRCVFSEWRCSVVRLFCSLFAGVLDNYNFLTFLISLFICCSQENTHV